MRLYCEHQGRGICTPWPLTAFLPGQKPATEPLAVRGRSLEACRKRATLWEPQSFALNFSVDFFFCLGRSNNVGWLQLLPNFWGKVPSAYGKESIWPTVFISQPGFFQAWQITCCLLRSNISAKFEFLKMKGISFITAQRKGSEKRPSVWKIPFVYAQTKQPRRNVTKFHLE